MDDYPHNNLADAHADAFEMDDQRAPVDLAGPPSKLPRTARKKYYRSGLLVVSAITFLVGAEVGVALEKHNQKLNAANPAPAAVVPVPVTPQDRALVVPVVAGSVDVNAAVSYGDLSQRGTGIVLSASGLVLTNNHIIQGSASLTVTDLGNHHTYAATVVGYDRTEDIAVLQLTNASGLAVAPLASSSALSLGAKVIGVGNAGGRDGAPSITAGTLTSINQDITAKNASGLLAEKLTGLLETSTGVVPGDSGGPLVSSSGKVIGIDVAAEPNNAANAASGQSTVSYAIPLRAALRAEKAIVNGSSSPTVHVGPTAVLGVEVTAPNHRNDPTGASTHYAGAFIAAVATNSPMLKAGLVAGDTIDEVAGVTIASAQSLAGVMSTLRVGSRVRVQWFTATGVTRTTTVTLASGAPQ